MKMRIECILRVLINHILAILAWPGRVIKVIKIWGSMHPIFGAIVGSGAILGMLIVWTILPILLVMWGIMYASLLVGPSKWVKFHLDKAKGA